MIIYTTLSKQNALHAVYAEFKGLHFGLLEIISRFAKGKIISCLSVFQYLARLRGPKRGLYAYIGSLR